VPRIGRSREASVEVSMREMITAFHGMLFGGFFLMAISGSIVMLLEWTNPQLPARQRTLSWQRAYLITMVILGWAAVLSGAYIVYPWYRAIAPAGADLAGYPQRLLIAHATTSGWHTLGMEWKEHVAWFAPMAATMVAFVLLRHRTAWNSDRQARNAVLGFAAAGLLAAVIAGGWGAMIDKAAPISGGRTIDVMRGER
jgi:hypothetical protein